MTEYLTVAETAALLRCSPKVVRAEIRRGRLPALRLGAKGILRIDRADLVLLSTSPTTAPVILTVASTLGGDR